LQNIDIVFESIDKVGGPTSHTSIRLAFSLASDR